MIFRQTQRQTLHINLRQYTTSKQTIQSNPELSRTTHTHQHLELNIHRIATKGILNSATLLNVWKQQNEYCYNFSYKNNCNTW